MKVAARLQSGRRFTVAYEPVDSALDPTRLAPVPEVSVWHNGTRVNVLLLADMSPNVLPGAGTVPVPALGLNGSGPFDYQLPALAPGPYTICGAIGVEGQQSSSRFCEQVDVVAE